MDTTLLYLKAVNKSIASNDRQKNNGYSDFTEYPLSRLPIPPDRCSLHDFGLILFYEHLLNRGYFIFG